MQRLDIGCGRSKAHMPYVSTMAMAQLVRIVSRAAVNGQRLIPMWISHFLMASAHRGLRQHKQRRRRQLGTAGAWTRQPWQRA